MRFRVGETSEAKAQLAAPAPQPKRRVRAKLRELTQNPYGPDTVPMEAEGPMFRVRAGGYRILFRPVAGAREVIVFRIGRRETVYAGLERPAED